MNFCYTTATRLTCVVVLINRHQEINLKSCCIILVEYLEVNACLYNTHTQAEITSNAVNEICFYCENFFKISLSFQNIVFSEKIVCYLHFHFIQQSEGFTYKFRFEFVLLWKG